MHEDLVTGREREIKTILAVLRKMAFQLAGGTTGAHYHFLRLKALVLNVNTVHAIRFKGAIRPVINSLNVHVFCNDAQVCYLGPLASSMDCSHFVWHLEQKMTQKLSNFHPPTPRKKLAAVLTRTQMQVING